MWISGKLPLIVLAITLVGSLAADDHWTYSEDHGPSFWPEQFCAGSKQSPVNIEVDATVYDKYLTDVDPVIVKEGSTMKMGNNGHTVYLKPEATVHMAGAGLKADYHVAGPHFHWGSQDEIGSEHSVDGNFYPLEMHIVTFNVEKYGDLTAAVTSGDENALAVFGVFFKLEAENNTAYQPIIEQLSSVKEAESAEVDVTLSVRSLLPPITEDYHRFAESAEVDVTLSVSSLLPPITEDYYRYQGSLTTPTCNEVVIWTLFNTPVPISQYQLDEFRKVLDKDAKPLVNNFRPIQKLNGRKVYRSFTHPAYDINDNDDDPDNQASPIQTSFLWVTVVMLLSVLNLTRGLFQ